MNAFLPICTCPTCGQALPSARETVEALMSIQLSACQTTILRAMIKAYPQGVSMRRLVHEVYASGGPETAEQCIRSMVSYIRRNIARHGWTVPTNIGGRGRQALFRLAPTDESLRDE